MNDFGVFKAIQEAIRSDDTLSQKISAIVTEARPGMVAPYAVVRFAQAQVDIPCLVQSALVNCEIDMVSAYHGDQEIHELMSRLNFRLDGASLPVQVRALSLPGHALFKAIGQSQSLDKGSRIGKLKYQIKILIRR
jgi:hypothetical protein